MNKNIESTRKFYRGILRHLEPKVTRYDIYCKRPHLWMSVALRVFPLANLLNKVDFVKPGMSEVLELEKQMSALEVGNHQYFLNQLVGKIRHIIEEDTGTEDYYGYSFFTKGEMKDYADKPIDWFKKSFKQDDFTCEIIRSVFRGKMDIEWEIQKV